MTTQPFYNTGTAVLTNGSTAMVGTGTFWAGNIRAFDRVVGLDGKEAIVASVTDNTHIVLLRAWAGTTQATAAYEIWMSPDEIFLQTLARQIFAALQSSALTGIGTLTPAANTFPYFDGTPAAALASVTAFARSILDDPDATTALSTLGVSTFMKTFIAATTGIAALDLLTGRGADIASAATVVLNTSTGDVVDITGTVATSAITLADGEVRWTRAAAAWPLTVGASLILNNGGANYTCAAGDLIVWRGYAAGVVRGTIFPIDGFGAATSPLGQSLIASTTAALMQSVMGVREVLTAARTYYVRSDGSDANTGLVNNAGGAFLTIQKAIDTIYGLDLSIYNVTVQVQDGTWTQTLAMSGPLTGKGTVTILGNTGTPANVIWNVTGGRCITASFGAKLNVSGIEFRTTTNGECLCADGPGSFIGIGASVRFGVCASAHIFAYGGGIIQGRSNYSIVGAAVFHVLAQVDGIADVQGITITITGTPAFSNVFARSVSGSLILLGFNTFTGSATGARYFVGGGGKLDTNNSAITYLPGNAAGSVNDAGSVYS